MKAPDRNEPGGSLLDLFRAEAEIQTAAMTAGLLELERDAESRQPFDGLLRAAHTLKGAARIVNLQPAVRVTHAMEDCLVAAQQGKLQLRRPEIDLLFRGVDFLLQCSRVAEDDLADWEAEHAPRLDTFLADLQRLLAQASALASRALASPASAKPGVPASATARELPERVLRLNAENLNRLLSLAGESLVESRWLGPFSGSMQRLRHLQSEVGQSLYTLRHAVAGAPGGERAKGALQDAFERWMECQQFLSEKLEELGLFDRRSAHLSHRLYLEVLRARMRPFGDTVRRFPRVVREMARALGKEARLEISGEATQVDRDILERLEGPLAHLLRNAIDHGCETPSQREKAGKPREGLVQLQAFHSGGMLVVAVADDGPGVDLARLRRLVVEEKFTTAPVAAALGEAELLEFLFLPGLSLKNEVTEISGRGIGLDVVQNMVKGVRGSIRASTRQGQGTRIELHLPLTLSVLRTLLVYVGGEPYALPLSRISRTLKLPRDKIQTVQGRRFFMLESQQIGLYPADQVLECGAQPPGDELPVVVLGDRNRRFGLVVERFTEERELVVQPLDSRLGKVKDIHAAALMEDGSPVLVIDVDDLMDSMERRTSRGAGRASADLSEPPPRKRKRILAVDDSFAVRELERKLLSSRGYVTDVAVDGIDGWNAACSGHYDLVITDVDMPRMDGIELTSRIKRDPHLKCIPVLIVSYKNREGDRLRGLEAGADYYLTKASFHDETLLETVMDLIGPPEQ